MTSNFKTRYGQTFDILFEAGEGTQTFGIVDNDGVDIGQAYLPASEGDPAAECGFLDSTGEDIGPKLCLINTSQAGVTYTVYTKQDSTSEWDEDLVWHRARLCIQITTTKECTIAGSFTYSASKPKNRPQDGYEKTMRTSSFSKTVSTSGTYDLFVQDFEWAHSWYGIPGDFSGTITCKRFVVPFSTSNASGSF